MTRTEMPLAVTFDLDGAVLESESWSEGVFLQPAIKSMAQMSLSTTVVF